MNFISVFNFAFAVSTLSALVASFTTFALAQSVKNLIIFSYIIEHFYIYLLTFIRNVFEFSFQIQININLFLSFVRFVAHLQTTSVSCYENSVPF